jgi:anaerobic magnesium-protoporphyrin IX monomethyl ester cyclase
MRVHLINPPAHHGVAIVREGRCMQRAGAWTAVWAPISLATIAAVLEAEGIECRLDDCIIEGLTVADLLERARGFEADLFVLNTATPSIDSDLALADSLKQQHPSARVAAIGIHVTALPEDALAQAPGLDAVVRGEPELTVRALALAQRDGRPWPGIAGATVRTEGGIAAGPDREGADLDALPFPAWHLVRRELYRLPFSDRPFLLIGTSRGCPHACAFCADPAYYGHALRVKSPDKIVAELRVARDSFGIRDFLFWSESFTLKRDWTRAVLEAIIAADLGVRFVVNSRVDHVDPDLLALLARAGAWMIGYGIESGDEAVLRAMHKTISRADSDNAVRWSRQAGLRVTAHVVLGFPGETLASLRRTVDFVCALPLDFAQFYCAVPFPGSRLYDLAREQGLLNGAPWERFEQNRAVISTPTLAASEVEQWRRRAYRRFYFRPGRIYRVLREDVGWRGAPNFARMLLAFREWM